jgi:hypothetical protein
MRKKIGTDKVLSRISAILTIALTVLEFFQHFH